MRFQLLLSLSLLVGCDNKALINEVAELERRACACKDAACVDTVVKDVEVWFHKNKDKWGNNKDLKTIEASFTHMGECMGTTGMSDASMKTLEKIAAEADKL